MQNRYVGDVGDFGKYVLLKNLSGASEREKPQFCLGIVWYLNPHEEGNTDGNLLGYLNKKKEHMFRPCDPELYDGLRKLLVDNDRIVSAVRDRCLLPQGTIFYEEPMNFSSRPENRKTERKAWCEGAFKKMLQAELVFLDPDNGLATETSSPGKKSGVKYTFPDEICPYVENTQSLILYQHQNHSAKLHDQIRTKKMTLAERCGARKIWAVTYHRGQVRIFLIIPAQRHEHCLADRLKILFAGPCHHHFRLHI